LHNVDIVELGKPIHNADLIISSLKLRTLHANIDKVAKQVSQVPLVVYDEDPWECYREGSPYNGTYDRLKQKTNLKFVALPSKWWVDYVASKGIPTRFIKLWVLPEYCDVRGTRKTQIGFIGAPHPYRMFAFEEMKKRGIVVNYNRNKSAYRGFLTELSSIFINFHYEHREMKLQDGTMSNLCDALWGKDVEAAARGCWSLRNIGHLETKNAYCDNIPTIQTYSSFDEAAELIKQITARTDHEEIRKLAVDTIRDRNCWKENAEVLLSVL
jgi:hypothetical protein